MQMPLPVTVEVEVELVGLELYLLVEVTAELVEIQPSRAVMLLMARRPQVGVAAVVAMGLKAEATLSTAAEEVERLA